MKQTTESKQYKESNLDSSFEKFTPSNKEYKFLEVAKLGRTIGVNGAMALFLLSDFEDFLTPNLKIFIKKNGQLLQFSIKKINLDSKTPFIEFNEINSLESAKFLVNSIILTTIEETKKRCKLKKDEFFYFDVIGLEVFEDQKKLGKIIEIERINTNDYFIVKVDSALTDELSQQAAKQSKKPKKIPETFMIPYIENFIISINIESKQVLTKNALEILKASF